MTRRPFIPVIDLTPFFTEDATTDPFRKCIESLARACVDKGMFYVRGHQVPQGDLEAVLTSSKEFFARPLASKRIVARRLGDMARGYDSKYEEMTSGKREALETFDVYKPVSEFEMNMSSSKILMGENCWPAEPAHFREALEKHSDHMQELGHHLMRALVFALKHTLGMDIKAYDPAVSVLEDETLQSFWNMRAISYPPLPKEQTVDPFLACCGPYSDYGCVTILATDEKRGALQVLSENEKWRPVDPVGGSLLVTLGDMMKKWTNGLWKSPVLRVMYNKGKENRISQAFSYDPGLYSRISPIGKCVQKSGIPSTSPPIIYGDYLRDKVNFGEFAPDDAFSGIEESASTPSRSNSIGADTHGGRGRGSGRTPFNWPLSAY